MARFAGFERAGTDEHNIVRKQLFVNGFARLAQW
jgi:hypothetical protein